MFSCYFRLLNVSFHLTFPILIPILQIVQYRQQSDLAFMLLVKSQNLDEPVDLDELMRYSLTPVPPSLVQLMVSSISPIKLHFYISSQTTIRRIFLIRNVPYTSKMAMHFFMS